MRKWHFAAAVATVCGIPALAAGCDPEPVGELVLIVKTDMAPPKDFNKLRIEVFNEGSLKFEYEGPLPGDPEDAQRIVLPSTLGLLAPEDPANAIRIEVGVRSGTADGPVRVVREVVTTIPADRVAMLNIPIQFLCKNDNIPFDNDNHLKPGDCPEGKTCIAGRCEDSKVDSATLPDYNQDEVYGGSGDPKKGTCFDVQKCFSTATLVDAATLNLETCTFPLANPDDAANLNFALGVETDGICNGIGCFVALDAKSDTGWKVSEDGTQVIMPKGVCENLAAPKPSGLKVLQVVQAPVSDECPLKETKYPTCGPWSAVESSGTAGPSPVAIAGAQDHPIAVDIITYPDCVAASVTCDATCIEACTFAYWTNGGANGIKGASLSGGKSASVESPDPPRDILATSQALIWTAAGTTGQGAIYAYLDKPKAQQDPLVLLQGMLTQPDGIAAAGKKIFWTEFLNPGRVFAGTLNADSDAFEIVEPISVNNSYPVRISADIKYVYWTNESTSDEKIGSVIRVDHTKATPVEEKLTPDPLSVPRVLSLDLDEVGLTKDIYFATLFDGKVWRIPNAGTATPGAPEVFVDGLSAPNGLALDGKNIYIASRGNGTIAYKSKTAANADPAKVIATGQKNPGHIVVFGTTLIWVNEGPSLSEAQEGSIVTLDVSSL